MEHHRQHSRRNWEMTQICLDVDVGNGMCVLYQVDPELLLRYFIFCWWHVTVLATDTKVALYDCLIANNFLFVGYLLIVNYWQFTRNDRGRMRIWIRSVYVFTCAYSRVNTWQFRGMVGYWFDKHTLQKFHSWCWYIDYLRTYFLYEDFVMMLLEIHEYDK